MPAQGLAPVRRFAAVCAAGAAGAALRVALTVIAAAPLGTLLVNVSGALAIGLLAGRLGRAATRSAAWPPVATGLLGGYTTFSAYAVDTVVLAGEGRAGPAAGYALLTLAAGLLATRLGLAAGRRS